MIRDYIKNNYNIKSREGKVLLFSLIAAIVLISSGIFYFTHFIANYHKRVDQYFLEITKRDGVEAERGSEEFDHNLSNLISLDVFSSLFEKEPLPDSESLFILQDFYERYNHILDEIVISYEGRSILINSSDQLKLDITEQDAMSKNGIKTGTTRIGNKIRVIKSFMTNNGSELSVSCTLNLLKILAKNHIASQDKTSGWKFITDENGTPICLIDKSSLVSELKDIVINYPAQKTEDIENKIGTTLIHKAKINGVNQRVLTVIIPIKIYDQNMNIVFSVKYMDVYGDIYTSVIIETIIIILVLILILSVFIVIIRKNKRNKEMIKQSADRFRAIHDTIMDMYYKINTEGVINDITPSCKAITGWEREELIGEPVTKVVGKISWEQYKIEVYENLIVQDYELTINHKDGHGVYVSTNGQLTRDENGSIIGIAGILRDISDRKKGEQALTESENKVRSLIDSASDAIITTNENSEIKEWNRAAELIFGYTLEYVKDNKIDKIIPREIQKKVESENLKKQSEIEHTVTGKSVELIGKRSDGEEFPIEMSIASWVLSKKIYHTLIVRDITTRKEIEAELRDAVNEAEQMNIQLEKIIAEANKWAQEAELANRSKSKFLANMSHEIRTPMNAILGFSELLALDETEPQKQEYLGAVISSGKALLNLINDILDLSKIESGKITLRMEAFSIRDLFKEVRMILGQRAEEKGLNLQVKYITEIPASIISDEERIRQVLINLINNSIKFTHHGQIKVVVGGSINSENSNEYDLRFSVEDSGIGIAPKKQNQIFEDFVQADIEDQRKYEGTGLGLSITKKIVEMMGGTITLQSELGAGSKFTVSIPKIEISDEILEKTSETTVDFEFNESTVLIVEDNQVNQKLMTGYFASTDLNVLIANNGLEGIEMATEHKPDLILMDIQMPVMDGYEAMRRLRRDSDLKSIPILALTASVLEEDRQKIMDCGADGFLMKPISRKHLYIEISRYLKHEEVVEVKTKVEEVSQDEDLNPFIDLSNDLIGEISKTIDYLSKTMLPKWKNFEVTLAIDEAAEVAREMITLGDKYAFNNLKSFGTEAKESAESMNLEKLVSSFSSFEDVITIEKNLVQRWLNE
jgi:PAS domain S-box-containing protein